MTLPLLQRLQDGKAGALHCGKERGQDCDNEENRGNRDRLVRVKAGGEAVSDDPGEEREVVVDACDMKEADQVRSIFRESR